jgi:hypothetical protein
MTLWGKYGFSTARKIQLQVLEFANTCGLQLMYYEYSILTQLTSNTAKIKNCPPHLIYVMENDAEIIPLGQVSCMLVIAEL